jgi:hypothetical protein
MDKLTKQKSNLLDFMRESADQISGYCAEFQAEFVKTANGNPPEFPSYNVEVLESYHYHLGVILEKLKQLDNKTKNSASPEKVNGALNFN